MSELKPSVYQFNVQRPLLLQQTSIATATAFNQVVKIGEPIKIKNNQNPKPKNENLRAEMNKSQKFIKDLEQKTKNNGTYTTDRYYVGSSNPYPAPNNFLFNKRVDEGKVNWEK